jgi:hypothetical protein
MMRTEEAIPVPAEAQALQDFHKRLAAAGQFLGERLRELAGLAGRFADEPEVVCRLAKAYLWCYEAEVRVSEATAALAGLDE